MLEVIEIWKSFENQPLLCDLSLTVSAGEIVCLLGASGSGKSTLLRIIAGVEVPERGMIRWEGRDLSEIPAHRRNFGLVFQDYALFPHLTVAENVAFGLQMRRLPREEVQGRVQEVLRMVSLDGFDARRVTELSGGEQQRVALARALAPRPGLLMFDEPVGSLDRDLRQHLMGELRSILHSSHIPAIYVTHDQEEAFALADRVLLLHEGRIERNGTPPEVWRNPGSVWAARFLGAGNVVAGVQREDHRVDTAFGKFTLAVDNPPAAGEKVSLLIRPSGAVWPAGEDRSGLPLIAGRITAVISDITYIQERYKVLLSNGLYFFLSSAPHAGEKISLEILREAVQYLT